MVAAVGAGVQHAQAGAGRVQQDIVGPALIGGRQGSRVGGFGLYAGQAQPLEVGFDQSDLVGMDIEGVYLPFVTHEGGQVSGLAAGGGAQVQHPRAGLRMQGVGRQLGGGALDGAAAGQEGLAGGQLAAALLYFQGLVGKARGHGGYTALGEGRLQLLPAQAQGVGAQVHAGVVVLSQAEAFRPVKAEAVQQVFRQPLGIGQGQVQIVQPRFPAGQQALLILPPQVGAEHGVDQAGDGLPAMAAGQLHRLIGHGVGLDAGQVAQLVQGLTQDDPGLCHQARFGPGQQLRDDMIQGDLHAGGAVDQLGGQPGVLRGKMRLIQIFFQGQISIGGLPLCLQRNGESRLSGTGSMCFGHVSTCCCCGKWPAYGRAAIRR